MRRGAALVGVCALSISAWSAETLDEVVVSGERVEQLRAEVVRLEDAFNARYNELNTKRDFAIHCADEAPTGTRFKRRVCRPVFADDAQTQQARGFVGVLNGGGGSSQSAQLVILQRNQAFRDNVDAVTRKDTELGKLLEARTKAQERYSAAQRSAAAAK